MALDYASVRLLVWPWPTSTWLLPYSSFAKQSFIRPAWYRSDLTCTRCWRSTRQRAQQPATRKVALRPFSSCAAADQCSDRWSNGAHYQPRLHDLRHSFAVHRLISWYQQGADVQKLLPQLSTYLGHVHLTDTQVYLTMTPELLGEALTRFERYAWPEESHD